MMAMVECRSEVVDGCEEDEVQEIHIGTKGKY